MKRYLVFPLIIASLSLSFEMPQNTEETPIAETIIHEPKDTEQENALTIYKRPDFISKWNDQFVELEVETPEKKD